MKVTPKENRTGYVRFGNGEMISVDLKLKQIWNARETTLSKERYIVRRDNVLLNLSAKEFNQLFKEIG